VLGFGCAFVVFNAVVPFIYVHFIDAKFSSSEPYVRWLSVGYFFMAVYMTYVDYIFYVKKTHLLSAITTFNLAANIGLNILLVHRYGAAGAPYAFATTMFLVMVLAFIVSRRVFPMPWFYWLRLSSSR
jgi:O-antigen/teichoic acid export membrane protein